MSATLTPITVYVPDLVLNDAYQVRGKLDQAAIGRYADAMRAGQEFPPIVVARVNGAPVVVDGWHRVSAARRIGQASLPANLIEADETELAWLAAEANLKHGVPLKRGEARALFRAYVRAGRHRKRGRKAKSSREIATDLHGIKSHATILEWMRQDFPAIYGQMGRAEDNPRSGGGLPAVDPEERCHKATERAVADLIANARGVVDPDRRGDIIAALERALVEIRDQRPWTPIPAQHDDEF